MSFAGLEASQLWTLFGIAAAAVTLLYFLKVRRRRVEVPFSPLWSRVVEDQKASSLFKALKRIGSLLIQLAVVALIVLALSDPKLEESFAGCEGQKTIPPTPHHALIVLDASASMATLEGGKTRLERARAKAHEVVTALAAQPGQRVMVVQLDALTHPLSLWSADPDTLHQAVDAVAPDGAMDTPTAVDDALRFAQDTLRGREGAEVLLITDGAFPAIDAARTKALGLKTIRIGEAAGNIGIEALNVRPYRDDALTYAIWYGLHNDAERPVKASLFLYANPVGRTEADFDQPGNLVATHAFELAAQKTTSGVLPDVKFDGSRLFAKLVVASDDLLRDPFPRDDIGFAVVPERKKLEVQLVSGGNLFLQASLFLRENVHLTVVSPADYKGPTGFDVTVVDAASVPLDAPGNYFILEPQPGGPFEITGVLNEPQIEKVDAKHVLAKAVRFADFNIMQAPQVKTVKGDEVVVTTKGGAPLLFGRKDPAGQRKFVVLAFDIRKSLLPMNIAFPILVVNALNWFWQDPDGLLAPNRAGVPLSLNLPLEGDAIQVTGPAGAVPGARKVDGRVLFQAPRLGIYDVSVATPTAKDRVFPVAVNLMSADESRISPRLDPVVAGVAGVAGPAGKVAPDVWTAPPPPPPPEDPWLANLWRALLIGALGVVLLEQFTWHRRWTE